MVYIRFHHEPYVAHTDPDKRIETSKYHCRLPDTSYEPVLPLPYYTRLLPQPLCNGCNHKILK
ncbi:hypothetical protein M085_4213 [Bacteroides fragilis str. 3986 N(B)19]|nr:hypothetical protein M085_4213 [Bacteroides fragilis str. 3986 N(B)19]